jgi:signal transduction histidine kinase/sensor domain CHASE-containing protein
MGPRILRSFLAPVGWTLSAKLCIGLALVAVVGLLLGGLALDRAIRPAFVALEREGVSLQTGRSETLLQNARDAVESSATDYAVWDDSYSYVSQPTRLFEQQNLTVLGLVNLDINAIAYARFDGALLQAVYVDPDTEETHPSRGAAFGALVTSPRFRNLARANASFSEFARLDGRTYAVGAAQVFRSDGSGVPAGYVVMARELNDAFVSEALQITARVSPDGEGQTAMSSNNWHVVVPLNDAAGGRIGALEYDIARATTALGAVSIGSALLACSIVMMGVLFAVLLLTRILVVRRLETVTRHVRAVAADGVLAPLELDSAGDELGSLNRGFNAMIAQLSELREQVKEQAFLLGQSDLAASVIHNVRNSLNPVSVIIAQTLAEKPPIRGEDVVRALRELKDSDAGPERRERLAEFLLQGLSEWERRAEIRHEALLNARAALAESLEILRLQNEAATREIPLERFDALDLIRRNAAMARFAPWDQIVIDLPGEGVEVVANRLLLSQVVSNLITNALESIVAGQARPGHLAISLARQTIAGRSVATITLTDNGQGFDPAIAGRLFERGHSSKARGGGLGLHWCANTVRAMGGSLTLESDGPGRGARALVRLMSDEESLSQAGGGVLAA